MVDLLKISFKASARGGWTFLLNIIENVIKMIILQIIFKIIIVYTIMKIINLLQWETPSICPSKNWLCRSGSPCWQTPLAGGKLNSQLLLLLLLLKKMKKKKK